MLLIITCLKYDTWDKLFKKYTLESEYILWFSPQNICKYPGTMELIIEHNSDENTKRTLKK